MRASTRRLLLVGLLIGIVLAVLVETSEGIPARFRLALLPVALAAVIGGLVETVSLGRAEWQRKRPSRADYARTVVLFFSGLVLAVVALG